MLSVIHHRLTPATIDADDAFDNVLELCCKLLEIREKAPEEGPSPKLPALSTVQRRTVAYFRYLARIDSPVKIQEFYDRPRAEGAEFTPIMYSAALRGTSHNADNPEFISRVLADMAQDGHTCSSGDYSALIRAARHLRDLPFAFKSFRSLEMMYTIVVVLN